MNSRNQTYRSRGICLALQCDVMWHRMCCSNTFRVFLFMQMQNRLPPFTDLTLSFYGFDDEDQAQMEDFCQQYGKGISWNI